MTVKEMQERLQSHYRGATIEVVDLTGTADHYQVQIESEMFAGLSRMQCQRQVMDLFASELKTGEVHALTIKTILKK